ncbi:hypothetical protein [Thermococcus sp.]|uniref:hypothetical protein n=1 Tax=Thermococcus sp. TaxID=35749 RepID=UPI00261C01D9|nr:hypothetical protein [Thermococcus sp.]
MVVVKRSVVPLALALVLAIVGAALAVPTFTLHVQNIGEGGPQQITVPGGVANANVNWVLDSNPDYVKGVKVSFDQDLSSGTTIYVKVYNSSGTVIAQGSQTLSSDLSAGSSIEIDFSSSVEIGNMDQVAVVLVGPQQ